MKTAIHIFLVAFAAAVLGAVVAISIAPARVDPTPTAAIAVE